MTKVTDMQGLKSLAHALLYFDLGITEMSPIAVIHPFTDTGIVGLKDANGKLSVVNILEDADGLARWRQYMASVIDSAEDPMDLVARVTNNYALGFLKYAIPYLSKKDLSEMLSHIWTATESPNNNPNLSKAKLLSMFKTADREALMDEDERRLYAELNDVVTVYRGVTPYNADNVKALSWTLNRETAEWFAHRYGQSGTVYVAKINKAYVYALFTGRGEAEVIVDPKHLTDISPVETKS